MAKTCLVGRGEENMWEEKSLMNKYDFQLSVYIIHLFHCLIFSAIRIFLYLQIPVLPNVSSIDTTKKNNMYNLGSSS